MSTKVLKGLRDELRVKAGEESEGSTINGSSSVSVAYVSTVEFLGGGKNSTFRQEGPVMGQ